MICVADVADALEECTRCSSLKTKEEVLRLLFEKCDGSDEIEGLLRVLLPNEVCFRFNMSKHSEHVSK
jgi:hypothetical protein